MRDLDGSDNKSALGANAILAVSLATSRAAAAGVGLPSTATWAARWPPCCRCR